MITNAELIAIIALAVTASISAAGAAFALGGLPLRREFKDANDKNDASHKELSDKNDTSHKELSDKIDTSHKELSDKIDASHKELSDKIDAARKEFSDKIEQSNANLLTEIRRSHQQLLRALINHRHLEVAGEPIFTEPPDAELVAADN